jgi:hypothetical protein
MRDRNTIWTQTRAITVSTFIFLAWRGSATAALQRSSTWSPAQRGVLCALFDMPMLRAQARPEALHPPVGPSRPLHLGLQGLQEGLPPAARQTRSFTVMQVH